MPIGGVMIGANLNEPEKFIRKLNNSLLAWKVLANNGMFMDAVVASEAAMGTVVVSEVAMNIVVANEVARNAIWNSETVWNAVAASNMAVGKYVAGAAGLNPADYGDMDAVTASKTAMNAVAASEVAMDSLLFSDVARPIFWDSEIARNAVFSNTIGRRKYLEYIETNGTDCDIANIEDVLPINADHTEYHDSSRGIWTRDLYVSNPSDSKRNTWNTIISSEKITVSEKVFIVALPLTLEGGAKLILETTVGGAGTRNTTIGTASGTDYVRWKYTTEIDHTHRTKIFIIYL